MSGLRASEFTPETATEYVTRYIENHRDDLFFLKSDDWEAEHEFRILHESDDSGKPTFLSYGDALRYVVLGANYPPDQHHLAEAAVARLPMDVEVCRMYWDFGHPVPLPTWLGDDPATRRDLEEAATD